MQKFQISQKFQTIILFIHPSGSCRLSLSLFSKREWLKNECWRQLAERRNSWSVTCEAGAPPKMLRPPHSLALSSLPCSLALPSYRMPLGGQGKVIERYQQTLRCVIELQRTKAGISWHPLNESVNEEAFGDLWNREHSFDCFALFWLAGKALSSFSWNKWHSSNTFMWNMGLSKLLLHELFSAAFQTNHSSLKPRVDIWPFFTRANKK